METNELINIDVLHIDDAYFINKIEEAKKSIVNINPADLNYDSITSIIINLINSLNKITLMLADASYLRGKISQIHKISKFDYDIGYNKELLSPEISGLKSADLRTSKASVNLELIGKELEFISARKILIDEYQEVLEKIYNSLQLNLVVLKEQLKIYQNMNFVNSNSEVVTNAAIKSTSVV